MTKTSITEWNALNWTPVRSMESKITTVETNIRGKVSKTVTTEKSHQISKYYLAKYFSEMMGVSIDDISITI